MTLQNFANHHEFILLALIISFFLGSAVCISWFCINLSTKKILTPYHSTVSAYLSVPTVMFSLTAALLASSLWDNYSNANKAIRLESQGLFSYITLAENTPKLLEMNLPALSHQYAKSVATDEWLAMSQQQVSEKTEAQFKKLQIATFDAVNLLGNSPEAKILLNAYQNIHNGRISRLSYSSFDVHPIRWVVVIVLAVLVQLGVGSVHLEKPKGLVIAMPIATVTILIALCTIALTLSSPYSGTLAISNHSYVQLFK